MSFSLNFCTVEIILLALDPLREAFEKMRVENNHTVGQTQVPKDFLKSDSLTHRDPSRFRCALCTYTRLKKNQKDVLQTKTARILNIYCNGNLPHYIPVFVTVRLSIQRWLWMCCSLQTKKQQQHFQTFKQSGSFLVMAFLYSLDPQFLCFS